MEAGKLRHPLEVQTATEVRDDIGGTRFDWAPLRVGGRVQVLSGSVEPGRSKEFFEAQKIEARLTHEIVLRYYPNFSPQWRLRFVPTTRIFQVYSVRNIAERNRMLKLMAIEILDVPAGQVSNG